MFELCFGFVLICTVIDIVYCIVTSCARSASHSDDDILYHQQMNQFQQQQLDESRRVTGEGLKSVTPFEMGGYDMTQGNSWNYDNNFSNDFGGFNDFGGMF